MLGKIQKFFEEQINPAGETEGQASDHALHLATAALLFEVSQVDLEVADTERQTIAEAVQRAFHLSSDETQTLMELAREEAAESVSLHQFTSLINQHFSEQKKVRVVEMLWQVAYADGHKDKYEEHIIRRLAELLYVPHTAFVQAREKAAQQASQ